MDLYSRPKNRKSWNAPLRWQRTQLPKKNTLSGWRRIHAKHDGVKSIKARLSRASRPNASRLLRAHSFFKGPGRHRKAKMIARIGNTVRARSLQVAISAFSLN